jgi:hypothetical protein
MFLLHLWSVHTTPLPVASESRLRYLRKVFKLSARDVGFSDTEISYINQATGEEIAGRQCPSRSVQLQTHNDLDSARHLLTKPVQDGIQFSR